MNAILIVDVDIAVPGRVQSVMEMELTKGKHSEHTRQDTTRKKGQGRNTTKECKIRKKKRKSCLFVVSALD